MSAPFSRRPAAAQEQAVHEAAGWYACLTAEDVTPQDRQDWQVWLDASPAHRLAWERLQHLRQTFERVPGAVACAVLSQPARRRLLRRGLLSLAGMGLLTAGAYGTYDGWRRDLADSRRTATGEQRQLRLDDGSQLYLNTATRVTLDFNATHRRIVLRAGEILVQTHRDTRPAAARPFIVATPHGDVLPLGTRFTVRLDGGRTRVQVLQHAVAIQPRQARLPIPPLQAGQTVSFDAAGAGPIRALAPDADAWLHGWLAVVDRPLADVAAELARYRPGILDCDPAVAGLKISGVLSLRDTDEALETLADSFPVQARRRTRYWVTLLPR